MKANCQKTRSAFTIAELLVAAGVSLLLMVIITEAFKRGIDMFRTLRAQGNMQERLRGAGTALRDDISAHHFPVAANVVTNEYLSTRTNARTGATWNPPAGGYFRIFQQNVSQGNGLASNNANDIPAIVEGTDRDGMVFTRATSHYLAFTSFRKGTTPDNMYRTLETNRAFRNTSGFPNNTPVMVQFPYHFTDPSDYRESGVFTSRWAEIAYFLSPNGESANGTPLFNLHRRAKVLIPPGNPPTVYNAWTRVAPVAGNPYAAGMNPEISARLQFTGGFPPALFQPGWMYNYTAQVTQPRFRFGVHPCADNAADMRSAGLPSTTPFAPLAAPAGATLPRLQDELPLGVNDGRSGDDVILSDVLSFEIKVTWQRTNGGEFYRLPSPGPSPFPGIRIDEPLDPNPAAQYLGVPGLGTVNNTDYPFDYLPLSVFDTTQAVPRYRNMVFRSKGVRVFDTWSAGSIYGGNWNGPPPFNDAVAQWRRFDPVPFDQTGTRIPLRIGVKAVLIRIRVWDAKAEQTRQLTIIQDV